MLHGFKVSWLWAEQTKGHEKGSKLSALQMKDNFVLVWNQGLVQILTLQVLEKGEGGCLLLA
jgi:hypothetical protein